MRRHRSMAAAPTTHKGMGGAQAQQPRGAIRGACDTHVHVLDPARFPFDAGRRYTPGPATVDALLAMHGKLGVDRVVVVQNSVYGSDHRCLRDALAFLGPERARGVATVAASTTAAEIAELDRVGVRGARLNLEVRKNRNVKAMKEALREVSARIPAGWHVHVNAALTTIAALADVVASLPAPLVLDHFAHIQAEHGPKQVGVDAVLDLLRSSKVFVKLSGPYQVSKRHPYSDVTAIARALVEVAPTRIMWGSDWPHTAGVGRPADQPVEFVEPFRPEDDRLNLSLLAEWVPDPVTRRRVLVDTPAALYGFPQIPT